MPVRVAKIAVTNIFWHLRVKDGMMVYLARDYTLYAELIKRKGDHSKAKENLNKAIKIFKECGSDGWVKKYEKEMPEL